MTDQEQFRPRYGETFRCIGSACEDTCCHGMVVPIDKDTYERYSALPEGPLHTLAERHVRRDIEHGTDRLFAYIDVAANGDCPFLDTQRLCGLQKEHGEAVLSPSCSIYPRVLNDVQGSTETSLYLSCPEAARQVLLDPDFMNTSSSLVPLPYRTTQVSRLGEGNVGLHKPFAYLHEIRSILVTMLRIRSRPFWQRLFLIGMLCKELSEIMAPEQDEEIPAILIAYSDIMANGSLQLELDCIPARPEFQLNLALQLGDLCVRGGRSGPRFQECFQNFLSGIGSSPGATTQSIVQQYRLAEDSFCLPLLHKYPSLLENYLLNYVFRTLFPFGREASPHTTPKSIADEFLLMATQYTMLYTLLVGVSGHYREAFGTVHVVQLVQSFSKAVEHDLEFLVQLRTFVAEQGIADDQLIAALLRA